MSQSNDYHISSRHLRFLLRAAEEAINKAPTLEQLQNQAVAAKAELQSIRSELAATTQKQALESATNAEEKDGRQNETYVCSSSSQICNLYTVYSSILLQ